jgi:uncharacterized protein (UPF0218 family)
METTPKQSVTITPKLRRQLKNPLGTLLEGTPEETMKKLSQLILQEKPKCIISVGDVVSRNMLKQGIQTQIVIVDNQVMRETAEPIKTTINRKVNVKNPPGTLTPEVWAVIDEALKQTQPTQVVVDGEEDLLALVAILKTPENSLVVYGQPHEGVVVVKVNDAIKKEVTLIIQAMTPLPKS